ncbi:MAG: glutathione S-transferase [Ectothiorhodospiraceae bacterium]|nr:glutathione S-transferase [Ectothiorhodospiraceae bacterium]
MASLAVWGRRNAFNVQKVLWFLDELGVPWSHHDAGGAFGGLGSPEFLAMNPHGRVPVVKDGNQAVWESHGILRYLAASYGGERFWPSTPGDRAHIDGWMDWAQTTLQPDFMKLFWSYYRTPEEQRDRNQIQAAQQACEHHSHLLDDWLDGRPYLAGEEFTLADIPAGTALYRYFEMGLETVRPPNVMSWYARLADRPAYRKHIMVPFRELRGRLQF